MDPVSIIKRKRPQTDSDKPCCFFCRSKTGDLRTASADGKARIRTVGDQRRELCDTSCLDIQERLRTLTEEDMNAQDIKWHKGCYSTFTSKTMLDRLRKQKQVSAEASTSGTAPVSCLGLPSGTTRRSSKSAIDWSLCMFCQVPSKRKIHRIETFEKSKDIIKRAQTDPQISTRVSGISDLIATEGCYHLPCLITFERRTDRQKPVDPQPKTDVDECMMTVCRDLRAGLSRGHVYDMGDVWGRYETLCSEMSTAVPKRYQSRRATFYEEIQRFVGQKASYVRPLSKGPPLMYPGEQSDFIIYKTLTKSQQHEMSSLFSTDSESTEDEDGGVQVFAQGNGFQEMVHVALRVRQDLLDTPGHTSTWHGLDQAHVDQVIPNSLYLLLRLLFWGITVVEDGIEEDLSIKQTVCSIAQDIVYAVSNKRKLTPKHVGLGLALHQATRSEALLNLFHAANHTVGIDTVRRIDTSIAQNILDRFVENGNVYVPDTLVRERMIHCSCDNIDVLEATLDGKNTFHCTQMMVWQRGPAAQQRSVEKSILRPRAIKSDALQAFQQLDPAVLPSGHRPLPCFGGDMKIEEEWFTNSGDKRQNVRAKDMAWVVSRIHDEDASVPSWGAMNEAPSVVDPPVTTAGMLPILQAPADDNDTLTTVINRFIDISHHMGQKHTIITADQPLYSRGKELVWANPKFDRVIFLMGGLHICFNFLKSIGQHMESAGLDDLWTEASVYAANTTETMMDGKAYYRAVRGHQLTYEALWHIKWPMFKSWLAEHGHEHDVAVEEFAQCVCRVLKEHNNDDHRAELCTAIDQLSDALRSEEVESLMEEFGQAHSDNPNFMLWSTYMSMVEILLDFIRAERDGDWILHLEAFTAMLPWLTIYDHTNYARWGPVYLADMKLLEKTAPEVHAEFLDGNFVVKRTKKRFNQVPADQATEWINRTCKMHNGIIGITRNDQARDKFCITWSERSRISQEARSLFNLEDDDEDTVFTRSDSLPSRTRRDADDEKKLAMQLRGFDVFRLHTKSVEEDGDTDAETIDIPLVSLATKDTAPSDVVSALLTAEERGMQAGHHQCEGTTSGGNHRVL